MRSVRYVVPTIFLAVAASAQTPAPDPVQVLASAREALGGEKRLSAVKTVIATGRTKQVRGDNLVPIEFEIQFELPDKYLRKDEIPAQESGPTTIGFNGDALIQDPQQAPPPPGAKPAPPGAKPAPPGAASGPPAGGGPPGAEPGPPGRGGAPAGPPGAARVLTVKQDFARLMLGMFAASFSGYPLTFTYAGVAEAPQGKADVIDVKGAGNFALRFFINSATHLPIMVSWQVPATNVIVTLPGQAPPASPPPGSILVEVPPPPPPTATKEESDKYMKDVADLRKKALAEAKPVEHRLYYSEYRDVDGMQFPFRLRRAIAGQTTEETTFDRFRINAKIDPRKFEVRK